MSRRVCITGTGIVSALGLGVDATLHSLLNGTDHIGPSRFIGSGSKIPAGEVPLSNAELAQMLNTGYPADSLRTALLGIMAAREAVTSAGLDEAMLRETAFVNGTTVGGMDKTEKLFGDILRGDASAADCAELRHNDCGYCTRIIADSVGKFAIVTTVSTACSSGANAIIMGANLIKAGLADYALVGGAEALTKFHINGFNSLMILDSTKCRPFDISHSGINLGEGAAYLVIESEENAIRRGAKIQGVLSGYANACDAFHQTASSADGEGAFLAMTNALKSASLAPSEIDYINSHGTGTPNNDETEMAAMKRIWRSGLPFFSSTKSVTGHTTSASGAIEAVICLLALNNGFVPANKGCIESIDVNRPVTESIRNISLRHVLNNSFGFGGNDSSLVFSQYSAYVEDYDPQEK